MTEVKPKVLDSADEVLVGGKLYEVGSITTYGRKGVIELTEVQA